MRKNADQTSDVKIILCHVLSTNPGFNSKLSVCTVAPTTRPMNLSEVEPGKSTDNIINGAVLVFHMLL